MWLVPKMGGVSFMLRTATASDAEGLLALWAVAAEAVMALIGRDPDATIVAESDSELVGSIIAGWDGWRYHLYRLAVRPDWRRRGVATTLMDAAEARFAALGATRSSGA
jgi:ribosomal protein S18 acetylase RimI-like enzyme